MILSTFTDMSKIAIVGYGNVGYHLAQKLAEKHRVSIFHQTFIKELNKNKTFDFVLLTVPDSAICSVSEMLQKSEAIVMHTSGSSDMANLRKHEKHGVLYPLQTFSKEKKIDFREVPLLVEGTPETEKNIENLAKSISKDVRIVNTEKRLRLHLVAIFACNFSNHLFHIAEKHLEEIGMRFQDIAPLLHETLEKALALNPSRSQTGPAFRRDQSIIDKHLNMLANENEKQIYRLITEDIQNNCG